MQKIEILKKVDECFINFSDNACDSNLVDSWNKIKNLISSFFPADKPVLKWQGERFFFYAQVPLFYYGIVDNKRGADRYDCSLYADADDILLDTIAENEPLDKAKEAAEKHLREMYAELQNLLTGEKNARN